MTYYILNGKLPIEEPDLMTWAKWFETADRVVKKTSVGDLRVSTVFLGLDHAFDEGNLILFETMIFSKNKGHKLEGYQERYATWQEAEEGHLKAVKLAKENK